MQSVMIILESYEPILLFINGKHHTTYLYLAGLALNSWVLLANLATNIVGSTRQKTSQLAKNIDENTNTKKWWKPLLPNEMKMKISVHLSRERLSRGAHRAAMIRLPVKSKKTKPTTSDTHFRHEGRDSLVNACLWLTYCWIIFVIRFGSKFVVMTMFCMWSLDVRNFESCFRFTAAIFLCAMRGTKGQLRLACATPKRPIGVPLSSRGHH